MRIGRLFIGWTPTNEKDRVVVASWSYVTGYWRWAVWRSPWRSWRLKIEGGYGPKFQFRPSRKSDMLSANLHIPLIGAFTFSTQPPMPSMKTWSRPRQS